MLNQVVLVGKFKELIKRGKICYMILKVPRIHRNKKGEEIAEEFKIRLVGGIVEQVENFLHKNDIVGIRGNLYIENNNTIVLGEKITFLQAGGEE